MTDIQDSRIRTTTPTGDPLEDRVIRAFERIREVDRPEVWIHLREREDVLAEARSVRTRLDAGEDLLLAGTLVAVKDNIDVEGMPTTAGCPEYARMARRSSEVVARLSAAGAIVLGKTNLDQFATGLVGTRSPYGAVRHARRPDLVSGGSSSGSAVAVALGIVDIALGTDTAGSGRVPAALHGIVGIKPSLGLVSVDGVVPACADYDAVTVFARSLSEAADALSVMIGPAAHDARSRTFPSDIELAAPQSVRLGVPLPHQLESLSPAYRKAWDDTLARVQASAEVTEIDIEPLLAAARLLYDGAIVAQRHAAVGEFIDDHSGSTTVDPTVAQIISESAAHSAVGYVRDLSRIRVASARARELLTEVDCLLMPTTTEHPSIAEVESDPVGINRRMGTFTNFCNLLDLCAVAVPGSPTADGLPFGVMLIGETFADQVCLDIADRVLTGPADDEIAVRRAPALPASVTGAVQLAVFGAHRKGAVLHHELESLGARFVRKVSTSDSYRLYALPTSPPKPGLVRVGSQAGAAIVGEEYEISPAGLGVFLSRLPGPMALARTELADGRSVVGFTCTHDAIAGARDITEYADWFTYLKTLERGSGPV